MVVMRLGAEQRAALHASARGRTERALPKTNCDDRLRDADRSDGARETCIVLGARLCWSLFKLMDGGVALSGEKRRSLCDTPR